MHRTEERRIRKRPEHHNRARPLVPSPSPSPCCCSLLRRINPSKSKTARSPRPDKAALHQPISPPVHQSICTTHTFHHRPRSDNSPVLPNTSDDTLCLHNPTRLPQGQTRDFSSQYLFHGRFPCFNNTASTESLITFLPLTIVISPSERLSFCLYQH